MGPDLLISEITGSVLDYLVPHNNKMYWVFLSLPINIMVSTTQTVSQIKSQEFIGHIQKHFITTSLLTYVTNGIQEFVKWCIKGWVHLDLRPDNMLFDGLQPVGGKMREGGGGSWC